MLVPYLTNILRISCELWIASARSPKRSGNLSRSVFFSQLFLFDHQILAAQDSVPSSRKGLQRDKLGLQRAGDHQRFHPLSTQSWPAARGRQARQRGVCSPLSPSPLFHLHEPASLALQSRKRVAGPPAQLFRRAVRLPKQPAAQLQPLNPQRKVLFLGALTRPYGQ